MSGLQRAPTSSIKVGSSFDNHMVAVDAGTSSLPLEMVPVVSLDQALATVVANMEACTVTSPISVPISASGPAMPGQLDSASTQGPESTPIVSVYAALTSNVSFQGTHNVCLHQSIINMADSIQHMSKADGNEQSSSRILTALSEELLPRAQFAEYDAKFPAPCNPCMHCKYG
ncbi:hypothetical protein BYT27DRAFT_7261506 [Phlegmacium glaucopus]|nr:hypothetical protein BYT27DRAFT_7261506 [Phlegmacium glaucopus]